MPNQTGPDVECVIWHEGIVTDSMVAGRDPGLLLDSVIANW